MPYQVAIVGAGLSGLLAARELESKGHRVTLFEKARGPGGRLATRRSAGYAFDFGAQYFTVRSGRGRVMLDGWLASRVVALWEPKLADIRDGTVRRSADGERRYVGMPRMSALTRYLADGLHIQSTTRVERIEPDGRRWRLMSDEHDLGTYDAVLVAAPPEQAAALLDAVPDLARRAASVVSNPCWAAMVVFPERLDTDFDAAFVHEGPLSWVARNASKPGRSDDEAWVLHASGPWSRRHHEADRGDVADALVAALRDATGCSAPPPIFADAHRWALAQAAEPLEVGVLWDAARLIGACGDWCAGTRVEGAILSGLEAGARIATTLAGPVSDPA